MKKVDSNWIFVLLDLFIIAVYGWGDNALLEVAEIMYLIAASSSFFVWALMVYTSFNDELMVKLMSATISSKAGRKHAERKFSNNELVRFFRLPTIFHISSLVYFILVIRDPFLIMCNLAILYYFRINHFIISSAMVRHLMHLDGLDAKNNNAVNIINAGE